MAGSIDAPFAKFARAEAQLEELRSEIERVFPRHKQWPVRTEAHRAGLEYRFYAGDLPSVEPDWALSAGEIMFNLRASLDYLAYELHVRHFGGKVPRKVEETSHFPIYTFRSHFRKHSWRIASLSKRDRRALENLQIYVARRDEWRWPRYWLNRLNDVHNVDKHRKLHLIRAAQGAAVIPEFAPEFGFRQEPSWGPVEPQAQVDLWTFTKAPPNVQRDTGAFLQIAIQHWHDDELMPMLDGMTNGVRKVLNRFRNRFE